MRTAWEWVTATAAAIIGVAAFALYILLTVAMVLGIIAVAVAILVQILN